MTSINRLFKLALNVNNARVTKTRIEREKKGFAKVVVEIKPYKRTSNRCPICGRKSYGEANFGATVILFRL